MAETIEELTIERRDEEDVITTQVLDKKVLSKGAWSTIVFLYQDLSRATNEFGPQKIRIQRYQKSKGVYRARSKFNISSMKQAKELINVLTGWTEEKAEAKIEKAPKVEKKAEAKIEKVPKAEKKKV